MTAESDQIKGNCIDIQNHLRGITVPLEERHTLGVVIDAIGNLCDQVARVADETSKARQHGRP